MHGSTGYGIVSGMERVVLDTNILVAALRSRRGPSYRLLSLVGSGLFEVTVSVALVLEYEDVLSRATTMPAWAIDRILQFLCATAHRQKIFFRWRPHLRDPGDSMVLELAVASRSRFIVTYNLRDFQGAQQFGVSPIPPESFLNRVAR